jgi:hypothetical protein
MKTSVITAPPGSFQREDVYARKRWRNIQYIAKKTCSGHAGKESIYRCYNKDRNGIKPDATFV